MNSHFDIQNKTVPFRAFLERQEIPWFMNHKCSVMKKVEIKKLTNDKICREISGVILLIYLKNLFSDV